MKLRVSILGKKHEVESGVRVSNTWVMYLHAGDNFPKGRLIPNVITITSVIVIKGGDLRACRVKISPRPISLLVR